MGFQAARSRDPCGVAIAQKDQAKGIGAADRGSQHQDQPSGRGTGRGLLGAAHNAGFNVFGHAAPDPKTLRGRAATRSENHNSVGISVESYPHNSIT